MLNFKKSLLIENNNLNIQEATAQDFPLIRQLAHQTWPGTFGSILSKEQIDYMLEMMYSIPALTEQVEKKGHRFILAKDEVSYLGFASYEPNYEGKSVTKIHKIYILPIAQGQGVGNLLIKEIEKTAQHRDNLTLSLNVNRDNPAIQFYQKLGFKKVREENIPIGHGFLMEDAVMEKELKKIRDTSNFLFNINIIYICIS